MKRSPGCLYTSDNKPLYDRQDDKMRRIEDIEEPLIEGALAPALSVIYEEKDDRNQQ